MDNSWKTEHRQTLAGVVIILSVLLVFNVVAYFIYRPVRTFNAGKPSATDKQLFFSVEKSGNHLYLMGITHQGYLDLYPLRPEIESAFASSDFLATERDLTQPLPATFSQGSFLDRASPDTVDKIRQLAATYQINWDNLEPLDALAVLAVFENQIAEKAGLKAQFGLDQYWTYRARQLGKPIKEVEGIEFEQRMATELVATDSDVILNLIPQDPGQASQEMLEHFEAILAGDFRAESLQADLEQSRAPAFQALYWTRRNEKMLSEILLWLDQGNCAFVAVGAGHVLGSKGLVSLLQENGCTVTQVE
ncbi:MAG: TraB/GumN family protein [Clostridia bacterium]|nr:TraB/GumN family protein [Clostridia bacterium]